MIKCISDWNMSLEHFFPLFKFLLQPPFLWFHAIQLYLLRCKWNVNLWYSKPRNFFFQLWNLHRTSKGIFDEGFRPFSHNVYLKTRLMLFLYFWSWILAYKSWKCILFFLSLAQMFETTKALYKAQFSRGTGVSWNIGRCIFCYVFLKY